MAIVGLDKKVFLYSWNDCVFGWDSIECLKSWDDFGRVDYTVLFNEQLILTDNLIKRINKDLRENITLTDKVSANVNKVLIENMLLDDTVQRRANFSRAFVESLVMYDGLSNVFGKVLVERILINEYSCTSVVKRLTEGLCIAEDLAMPTAFKRLFVESLQLRDQNYVDFNKRLSERMGLVENKACRLSKSLSEALRIADGFSHAVRYVREFLERLCVGDQLTRMYGLNVKEALQVSTFLIRNCNAVLSNILLTEEELTEEKFLARVNTAPGYNAFQDFSVGEYEFQKALVRIVIDNAQTQSEPLIYEVNHHVDIDDVVDGGVVNITDVSAPTKVRYNKFYYNHPEVSVILKGGNTGQGIVVPRLLKTDGLDGYGRFFEVELINSSNSRVAGSISWTSRGY